MPIIIPRDIPAYDILTHENIFVMGSKRAAAQDIRPLEIAIVNLMPTKIETETQLMRILSNSPLQTNFTLVKTASYQSTNVSQAHMDRFYTTFDDIKDKNFDGLIVTGAPVEKLDFNDVKYWDELCDIMDFAEKKVTSTIFICWGAQAAINYYYGIGKHELNKKLSGIYPNKILMENEPLLRGLNDTFNVPHSRYTSINEQELEEDGRIAILARGEKCGISIAKSIDGKKFFFFGHSEYDKDTLKNEYLRDIGKGLDIDKPENYFVNGDVNNIDMSWRSTGNLLYNNWLNYYVYQITPYSFEK